MKVRLPQGMGGGPSNMNQMIKQAQKMQEDMAAKQAELDEREFRATAGGGMVEVVFSGNKTLKSLTINPEIVDPDDVEMLSDVIMAAINEALRDIETTSGSELGKITGGLNIPGIL